MRSTMSSVARFERKYRLTPSEYVVLRGRLAALTRPDEYTRRSGGRYLVRSLYYDTDDLAAYREREEGLFGRIKLRLRVYSSAESEMHRVRVEIKTREGAVMVKHTAFVEYPDYLGFLKTRSWSNHDRVLAEFERLVRSRDARPVLLVQYQREALVSRDDPRVRITLDHAIHSTRADSLTLEPILLRPHRPRSIVLEMKTPCGELPGWVEALVRDHGLTLVSNSKYAQGIETVHGAFAGIVAEAQ
ncbi:MAG: polyphosphate polymerase domain-containing protein [Spirochaetota bacterium]